MFDVLNKWRHEHDIRSRYVVPSRVPFYDLAKKYLPEVASSVIVDIGPGEGAFAEHLRLKENFPNHRLLDINKSSIDSLKKKGFNAEYYRAPEKLPFQDRTVSYIHLSHIVEHLPYQELYAFMKEMDRVLCVGGVIVISTPLLWDRFYDDLSHVKPYNPQVFINYLTRTKENATQEPISTVYSVKELQYRFRSVDSSEWGSRYFVVDTLMRIGRVLRSKLGFRKYLRNGYTMILEKGA